ncbi:MAG: hypothetical protein WDM70_09475 [Nitrosomonadales bacterium]
MKRLYGITLTLSLLIVLLSAVSAAVFISNRLSEPLAALPKARGQWRKAILRTNTRCRAVMNWAR